MKVYIVTSGQYSDYCIDSVFTDRSLAEQHVKTVQYGGEIEEWSVNDIGSDREDGRTPYTVRMKKNGDPVHVVQHTENFTFSSEEPYYFDNYPDGRNLVLICLATDEQHAVNITNELRTRLIAENQWAVS